MNRDRLTTRGFSLIEAIVAVSIVAAAGMVLLNFSSSQTRAVLDVENMSDINAIRQRITKSMSCSKTLSYAGNPLSCASMSNLVPKTVEDQPMLFGSGKGEWLIRGDCIADEIIFKVTKGPKRKSDQSDWSVTKFAKDLYLGASDFCKEYFDPEMVPEASTAGTFVLSINKTQCLHPNLITGGCSCPPGYKEEKSLDFKDNFCHVDFFDQNYVGPCAFLQYVCYRLQ